MGRRNMGTPNVVQYYDPNNGVDAPVPISDNDPQKPSYRLVITNYAPPATPTDVLVIQGAAGVITRIREIQLSGVATSATNILFNLVRRSTADTGGTSAVQTSAKRDPLDGAAATVINLYSVLPSGLGTAVANAEGGRLNLAPASNASIDRFITQYSWMNEKGITLRGASDFLCLNLGGTAWPAGGFLDILISFTEE